MSFQGSVNSALDSVKMMALISTQLPTTKKLMDKREANMDFKEAYEGAEKMKDSGRTLYPSQTKILNRYGNQYVNSAYEKLSQKQEQYQKQRELGSKFQETLKNRGKKG